jgi:ABC-2 type transport system ATP-binding protein
MSKSDPPGNPADSGQALLDVRGLTKRYRDLVAVDEVTTQIEAGEFVGLIGPNGAGKTTMMACVAGTLAMDGGSVEVGGVDVASAPVDARRHIGFVSQDLDLYEYLTGREFLEFVAEVRGMAPDESIHRIEQLLETTELTDAQNRLLKEYSGGMARKITLASALLGPPDLLLLDESFVGLDPESTYWIRRELGRFCDNGGAILLSSHSLEMIREICSRVMVLVDGQLTRDMSSIEIESLVDGGDFENLTEIYLDATGKTPESLDH